MSSEGDVLSFFDPDVLEGGSFEIEGFDPDSGIRSISWESAPSAGAYTVKVSHFETEEGGGDTEFMVSVNIRGELQEFSGSIPSDGSSVEAGSFEI